jgi:hypothetical protein
MGLGNLLRIEIFGDMVAISRHHLNRPIP